MTYFPLKMYPIALPTHNSDCPLCKDTPRQMAWVIGSNKLNQMIMRGSAIIDNIHLEASLSYCPVCDFGYFYPTPPGDILERFYATGGGRGTLRSDEIELSELMNPSSRRDVNLLFQIINECGLTLTTIQRKKVLEIGPGLSSYMSAFIELGCEYWANEIGTETSGFIERIFKVPVIQEPLGKIPKESLQNPVV